MTMRAVPRFWRACMMPYAVPNWYSGIIKAAMGHKADASRLYATPSIDMAM